MEDDQNGRRPKWKTNKTGVNYVPKSFGIFCTLCQSSNQTLWTRESEPSSCCLQHEQAWMHTSEVFIESVFLYVLSKYSVVLPSKNLQFLHPFLSLVNFYFVNVVSVNVHFNAKYQPSISQVMPSISQVTRDSRLEELKTLLLSRDYKCRVVNSAIEKAKSVPRQEALIKVKKNKQGRPVFVVQYDPSLPSINSIVSKHWRSMVSRDPNLQ